MKRPSGEMANLFPPTKKQKVEKSRQKVCARGVKAEGEETFKGTVVKKLDCICFVSPDEATNGDVLLRADAFADDVFDNQVQKGSRVTYWQVNTRRHKTRAEGASIIENDDGEPVIVEVKEPEPRKCRAGEKTEEDSTFYGKVVKKKHNYCFVRPDLSGPDVLLREDSFKEGVFASDVSAGVRVCYWDLWYHQGKKRANGAEITDVEGPEETKDNEVYTGTCVKKLNRCCFVKPDNGDDDVLIRADAFDSTIFDSLLEVNHRVRYWGVHRTNDGCRADGAEIFIEEVNEPSKRTKLFPAIVNMETGEAEVEKSGEAKADQPEE